MSSVMLTTYFLQVNQYFGISLGGLKFQNDFIFDRSENPHHDLGILDFPLGLQILVFVFVRSKVTGINMSL
jgi:hypothetical protein